ncbi:hypothetical protein [Natronococcus sp.]|uniref:hypothetical protein n=1 Tax=Natronococcus sp. TaxID=35747 RepID=UPI003A4E2B12
MTDDLRSPSRRRLLAVSSSVAALCVAGCLDDDDPTGTDSDDDPTDDATDDELDDGEFDDDLVDEPFDDTDHEVDVTELLVYERDGEQVANAHAGHWHYETETGGLPAIEPGSTIELETVFTKDGEELPLDDESYRLGVELDEEEPSEVVSVDVNPATVSLSGEQTGETATVFQLLEDGDVVWEAPPIDTPVAE